MRITYSKPLSDVFREGENKRPKNHLVYANQKHMIQSLLSGPPRDRCILCRFDIKGDQFLHRGVEFIRCNNCGHIQTLTEPPADYPFGEEYSISYADSYPKLTKRDYEDRKNRIYKPKLDWIVSYLLEIGNSRQEIEDMRWLDIGCGAGYFLSSLREFGARNIS